VCGGLNRRGAAYGGRSARARPRRTGGFSCSISRPWCSRRVAARLRGSWGLLEGRSSLQRVSRSKRAGQFLRRRPNAPTAAMGDNRWLSSRMCSSACRGCRGDERGGLSSKREVRGGQGRAETPRRRRALQRATAGGRRRRFCREPPASPLLFFFLLLFSIYI